MAGKLGVNGVGGMTIAEVKAAVAGGAKFVVFPYAESWIVVSFRRATKPTFIRAGTSGAGAKAVPILHSLLFGWWGFPWGPIFTIGTIAQTLRGGTDVTAEVMAGLESTYAGRTLEPLPKA